MLPASEVVGASHTAGPVPRLRVLVIDEYFPFPPDSGKPIRTWNLLKRLAPRHDVTLLCHGDLTPEQLEAAASAAIQVKSVAAIPADSGPLFYLRLLINLFSRFPYSVSKHYTPRFRTELDRLLLSERFDLVHCEWTPYARYLRRANVPPTVIATHNIESQIWERRAEQADGPLSKWFLALQAQKMSRFEKAAFRDSAMITGVSTIDTSVAKSWGASATRTVDNGVDLDYFRPTSAGKDHEAIFVGLLDWFPNTDAVTYFAESIMPLLLAKEPAMVARIVGRRASASFKASLASRKGIELSGEVVDVRPRVANAGIVIVPLRIGGGSRIKILEALAMSKAVVSTSVGAEGLKVTDGKDIIIADTPEQFASAISDLSRSPETRQRLGSNGRALVEQHYSWASLANEMEQAWLHAVRAPGAAEAP